MAVIKSIPSKGRIKNIINYILSKEKTDSRIISGKDLSPQNAIDEMNTTKKLYGKTGGISYYHIIQSFKPGEVDPDLAHKVGMELAEGQFKGHEVLVATHIDKSHIHNHLVVNSVSFVDGRKLVSNRKTLREIKRESNRICLREHLATIEKPYAKNRYSMAEYKLAEKGMPIWKEQLRSAIDEAKGRSKNLVELKEYLKENFSIDMKVQNKNLSFLHPDKKKYCRGRKLGLAYRKEEIARFFEKSPKRNMVNPGLPYRSGAEKKLEHKNKIFMLGKTDFGFSKVGSGIESITSKISRDIEKEKIRVEKKKENLSRSRERYVALGRRRER